MTKEQYEKLNNYYNELCLGLSVNDSVYLNNLPEFGEMAFSILELLETYKLEPNETDDCLSFLEIYDKAKEIIKDINSDLLNDYDKIIQNGVLGANYERLEIPFYERSQGNSNYDPNNNTINMEHSFNYDAIPALIHEYFHKTNFNHNKARYVLTEYISIYFELYSYIYLINHGIDKSKLNLSDRILDLQRNAEFIDDESFVLYIFDRLGNFNEDTYKYITFADISKEELEEILLEKLDKGDKAEKFYNKNEQVREDNNNNFNEYLASNFDHYRYLLGSLLAYYSLYFLKKEDVLRLNNELIKNDRITLEEALNVLGVDLGSDEFKYKAIGSIHKFIEDFKLYQIPNNERSIK